MTDKPKKTSPPYSTFPSFINFINKLKEDGIPNRIDPSVFGNASGSIVYSVLSSLKSLKLIDENGNPSNDLKILVTASDEERPVLLKNVITKGYPSLFNGSLDLTSITAGQFDEHIREEFDVSGSTIDKIASFFLSAAKASNIPLSKHLESRKPIASSPNSRKSTRQRKKPENGVKDDGADQRPPPATISEKALEYRLVDLMTEAAGDADVMSAIITVITFLKTKDVPEKADLEVDD